MANIFNEGASYLQSDADQQLLLNIPFKQPTGLTGLQLWSSGEAAPAVLKLFVNNPTFGFDDAESTEPVQTIQLSQEDALSGAAIPLRLAKFRNVHSLQIFVEENHGADVTRIRRLDILGQKDQDASGDIGLGLPIPAGFKLDKSGTPSYIA
eukprot:TRINITY_DN68243_c0_g1_i1.p1 TRINITY_DN68243_c0_g1~~TRINITY_DN68243_c0_g1_i1.p1  ORF type:complete len:163 (+),score=43.70 TRINITY_DN68243_c0_g1_i1:35-490(+)